MKKSNQIIALLLLAAMLCVMACGCAGKQNGSKDSEMNDPNRDWEPIETKFGTLKYPDQFIDYVETEQKETEKGVSVLFRAKIGEKRIDMFEMTIGEGEGEAVGKLTGPDGVKRDVYLRFIELSDLSGLTEGEKNRVYAMQECLNFVIDNLK